MRIFSDDQVTILQSLNSMFKFQLSNIKYATIEFQNSDDRDVADAQVLIALQFGLVKSYKVGAIPFEEVDEETRHKFERSVTLSDEAALYLFGFRQGVAVREKVRSALS